MAIAESTSPDATIAVHAAGQFPVLFQSHDDRPAGTQRRGHRQGPAGRPFYPGHDKWDYDYSITQLKPDLIADNWIRLGDYVRRADYRQLDNGMYVRRDTTLVDVPRVAASLPQVAPGLNHGPLMKTDRLRLPRVPRRADHVAHSRHANKKAAHVSKRRPLFARRR